MTDDDDQLWDICLPYWDAFNELSGSRPMIGTMAGVFPAPLLYTEKAAYARDHGLADTRHDLDEFLTLLNGLDRRYLKILEQDRKKQAPPSSK